MRFHSPAVRRGFTMVELLVALSVAVVIGALLVEFVFWGASTFRRTEDRLDAREKVHQALLQLRQTLTDCWAYQVEDGGAKLVFASLRRDGEIRFDRSAGKLTLHLSDRSSDTVLVPAGLRGFRFFEGSPGYVHLDLEMERPRFKGQSNPLGNVKMSDRLYVPAVALRLHPMPWKPDFRLEQPDQLRKAT